MSEFALIPLNSTVPEFQSGVYSLVLIPIVILTIMVFMCICLNLMFHDSNTLYIHVRYAAPTETNSDSFVSMECMDDAESMQTHVNNDGSTIDSVVSSV